MTFAAALIGGTVLAWGLSDIYLYVTGRKTITSEVRGLSARWPILPFLAGVLVGHFWFQ